MALKTEVNPELYLSLPQFMWQGLFSLFSALIVGLVVAFVTTFYLKKKDEITRVAGVILEKRINSNQEIMLALENASAKLEMPSANAITWRELLINNELELPYEPHIQYADVFSSSDKFQQFFKEFEMLLSRNKLWLSEEVRFHMTLMQVYFSWLNALLIIPSRVPLPIEENLTKTEQVTLSDKLILLQGIVLDAEFNGLIAELEVLMVDSIYHLKLDRPKKSLMRNGLLNKDTKKILSILESKTLLAQEKESLIALAVLLTCQIKEVSLDEKEFEQFVRAIYFSK